MEFIVIGIVNDLKEALELCMDDKVPKQEQNQKEQNEPSILYLKKARKSQSSQHSEKKYSQSQIKVSDFQQIVDLVMERLDSIGQNQTSNTQAPINKFIYVRKNKKIVKIPIESILYFHVQGRYSEIVSELGKFLVEISLTKLSKVFSKNFLRSHRNYLVNSDKINDIDLLDFHVNLVSGDFIPMSFRYKDQLLKHIMLLK